MILAIDTSLGTAVAVVEPDGMVRAAQHSAEPLRHAEVIGDLLVAALAGASVTPRDITHVAAGMGPGPFTGLRIGIAAARAFASGRAIPVVPVVSHDAVALEVLIHEAMSDAGDADAARTGFAVVTDARRREVAYSVYGGLDDDGLPLRRIGPALSLRDEIDKTLAGTAGREATAVPGAMIGVLAARAISAGRVVGPDAPLYLRSPDVTPNATAKRVTA